MLMESVHVLVENIFAEVLNRWNFAGAKCLHKLSSMQVGKHTVVAFWLQNCYGIFYGAQVLLMFGSDLSTGLIIYHYMAKNRVVQ